ncbi:hypothetical protein EG327_011240 [Venturia inaequalis]|uniref:Uncharacterized protein n=1 Tax=Venturia inaequalis TaxID=5025 RepID=A0A8H3UEC5_VENIN|nr:hypothetical protein EG327_011240 [Venturia inaequalis]
MTGLFILLWALIASVDALAPHQPRETRNPPVRVHRRQVVSAPYPTSLATLKGSRCPTRSLASLFSDIYHDNPHFCTIYERGLTITITTDCKGCNLNTMTMPRRHCLNTANVTFRIPSTSIECEQQSAPTPTPTSTPTAAASDRIYPAGFKDPPMSAAIKF